MGEPTFPARAKAAVDRSLVQVAERFGRNRAYHAMSYLRSALWVVPIVSVLLALARVPDTQGLGGASSATRPAGG
jgi:hypothetical protein